MKVARWILAGLFAGFLAGIALSELIGIIGVIAFDREVGIKYLPFYLGARSRSPPLLVDRSAQAGQRP